MKTYKVATTFCDVEHRRQPFDLASDCLTRAVAWLRSANRAHYLVAAYQDDTFDLGWTAVVEVSDLDTALMLRLAL